MTPICLSKSGRIRFSEALSLLYPPRKDFEMALCPLCPPKYKRVAVPFFRQLRVVHSTLENFSRVTALVSVVSAAAS